jgi:hypothetical protein
MSQFNWQVLAGLGLGWACAGPPAAARAQVVADSVAEFSGVQGQNNWFYGYYPGPFTPANFTQMTIFGPPSAPNNWVVDYDPPSPQYWTALDALGGHPNGTTTSGGRDPVEQWAVRRWISGVAGVVNISGNIADRAGGAGNGIIGHVFVGNTEVFSATINDGDSVGTNYSVNATVSVGMPIDFAIDPRASNDLVDTTRFTAQLTPVPEPSSLMTALGACGLLGGGWLWRKPPRRQ